jgi:predicted DNA-binding protein
MYTKTLKHLTIIQEELETLLDNYSEKLLNTKSVDLQDDIEKNIINALNDVVEQIDVITENIETGSYDSADDFNDDY